MNDIIFGDSFWFYEISRTKDWYTDQRAGAPSHYIAYMREGNGRLIGEDRTVELQPGDFFYIPDGYPYQSYWTGEGIVRFDSYGFKHFPRPAGQAYPMQKMAGGPEALAILERLAAHKQADCAGIGLFYQLLGCLMEQMTVTEECRRRRIVAAAESYLYEHSGGTAEKIARHLGISESSLYAAFREARGYTPTQARHRMLTEKAINLLTTTDLTVETISERLGFSSSIYFRKILSEQTGKTPSAIRRERRI